MPRLVLPFDVKSVEMTREEMFQTEFFQSLTPPYQEACQQRPHLLLYLLMLPLDEIGMPTYVPEMGRKFGGLKQRNLIYPVSDDICIHIFSVLGEARDFYIPIDPAFLTGLSADQSDMDIRKAAVEAQLLDYAQAFADLTKVEEKTAALKDAIAKICKVVEESVAPKPASKGLFGLGGSKKAKVEVTQSEFEAITYLVVREKIGLSILQPVIDDRWIEDISGSGLGPIFLEHKVFNGVSTCIVLDTHEELDQFVLRLSETIKRPVTMRNPIVDAVLPDGSRINIVYGKEVSARGSNFSIRKFADTPISIVELVAFGSISYKMAAYLSMVLGAGMNTFVAGETASGKTTLINAITTFVPPEAKVVSIEDTPEVQVPHPNWIREVSKAPRKGETGGAEVSMMDLLKAALRQRPNLIIIGEIRGEEGAVAFQAMQTGHAVMATFHAASVEKLIQRLTGHPINVPKTYIDNLNVVIIQSAVKLPTGKNGRRALSISEIVGYDSVSNSFSFVEVFRWNQAKDVFEFVGDKNSYLLEEKIAPARGIPPSRKWEIYKELEKRAKVLERLHKDMGVTGYYELLKVLTRAQQEGLF